MNGAWTQGIPDTWKASNTILIPKAKKATYTVAKSLRPIQLQSIRAKVLERAGVQRIADLGLLEGNMYGGRKQNGTTDAIQAVTASWVVAGINRVTILSLYQSAVHNETKYRWLRLSCCNKLDTISQLPSSS